MAFSARLVALVEVGGVGDLQHPAAERGDESCLPLGVELGELLEEDADVLDGLGRGFLRVEPREQNAAAALAQQVDGRVEARVGVDTLPDLEQRVDVARGQRRLACSG